LQWLLEAVVDFFPFGAVGLASSGAACSLCSVVAMDGYNSALQRSLARLLKIPILLHASTPFRTDDANVTFCTSAQSGTPRKGVGLLIQISFACFTSAQ